MLLARRLARVLKIATAFLLVSARGAGRTLAQVVALVKILPLPDESSPQLDLLDAPAAGQTLLNETEAQAALYREYAAVLNPDKELNFASPLDADTILKSVRFLNAHSNVLNEDKFGRLSADSVSTVIVVQVRVQRRIGPGFRCTTVSSTCVTWWRP